MANALYGLGRNKFARGEVHWIAAGPDNFKVCLVKDDYLPQIDVHEFFSDLGGNAVGNAGGATRADCPALTEIDPVLGVCDANNVTLTAVPVIAGQCDYICIFLDDGVADASSPLIALIDTAVGLPVIPNGGDITIQWDDGANKIFKL